MRVDQTRADGGGELVGVGDAILAGVAVAREQFRKVEVRLAGVEHRQTVLGVVGHVQVEQLRLQGLQRAAVGDALEVQAAFAADHRQRALRLR